MIAQSPITIKRKGFASLYYLIVLMTVLFYSSCILSAVNQYINYRKNLDAFRRINNAEVLTILRIKRNFKDYSEQDEQFRYEGCQIEIYYEGLKAEYVISYKDQIRERTVIYDEQMEVIEEYY